MIKERKQKGQKEKEKKKKEKKKKKKKKKKEEEEEEEKKKVTESSLSINQSLTSRLLFLCIAVSWNVFTSAVSLFVRPARTSILFV